MPLRSPRALATAMPSVIPMSSTVWWASISRSPFALTVRSTTPWRAIWSSMWSRNGTPEARLAFPVPSRFTATKTWVSLVSLWISAVRMVSADRRGKGLEEALVLVGGPDREAQAVFEQGMGAVEVLDQYTTRLQALERARRVRDAGQDEVGRGGKTPHAGDAIEARLQPCAVAHDRVGLLLQHVVVREDELRRRRGQHVHVVGKP